MMTELIENARKALQRGEREVDGYQIITSKIDLDVKLSEDEKIMWNLTRRAMVKSYDGTVVDLITTDTDRGQHTVINWLSWDGWSDKELNFMQLLLGDDIVRYKINKARLDRGVKMEDSNILFSKVLERFGGDGKDSKLLRAIENIVGDLK